MRKSMGCSIHHKALTFGDNVVIFRSGDSHIIRIRSTIIIQHCQQPTYGNMYRRFNFEIQYIAFRLSVSVIV